MIDFKIIIITLSALAVILHILSFFVRGVLGRVTAISNLILHLPLYFLVSLEYRELEITLLFMMASLLIFLLLAWGRVTLFRLKRGKEEDV